MQNFFTIRTVSWIEEKNAVRLIDQTKLPTRLEFVEIKKAEEMADSIKKMVVRGAPAIGVAAAMGVVLSVFSKDVKTVQDALKEMNKAASLLRETRPTAVNLFWGIDRMLETAEKNKNSSLEELRKKLVQEAIAMQEEDVELNRKIGYYGNELIRNGDTVLTQCNAGALATVGYGTALGVVRKAVESGKVVKVIVPETRPQLQGSRLTAFELSMDGIECRIIPDTAVGYVMQNSLVDKVIVGADRITMDGYVFNKIGTYQIAVLCSRHGIPFYVAAPHSSFDLERSHDKVKIEERSYSEVTKIKGRRIAPKGVPVLNPAFDSTPPELVTAIITDKGIINAPIEQNIARVLGKT